MPHDLPFLILTGFLGAGKTTLLNRLLDAPPDRRVAVVVNDLGRVNIDKRLVEESAGDLIELAGGCVCCALDVNRDLWLAIRDLRDRADPEVFVLETTGVAEPGPLVRGARELTLDPPLDLSPRVICVIDVSCLSLVDAHEEARAQIQAADAIVLGKLDLARPGDVEAAHRLIDGLNRHAARVSFPPGAAGTAGLARWLLHDLPASPRAAAASRRARPRPDRPTQLRAACVSLEEPLLGEPLLGLVDRLGDGAIRIKGFVHLAGSSRRGWLEKAGGRIALELRDGWNGEPPRTDLVFIGPSVDERAIAREVWACRSTS
jgi:G3E family GTPase